MGSFISRAYAAKYGEKLSGLICCGTSGPNPMVGFGIALTSIFKALQGPKKRSKFVKKLAFAGYNKKFENKDDPSAWLSRDPSSYADTKDDPSCNFTFTNAGFNDLFRLLHSVSQISWSESIPQDLPVVLFSGDMDPVGQYGSGVRKVYQMLLTAGVKSVEMKLYAGARHELYNETIKDEFIDDVVSFIEKNADFND